MIYKKKQVWEDQVMIWNRSHNNQIAAMYRRTYEQKLSDIGNYLGLNRW